MSNTNTRFGPRSADLCYLSGLIAFTVLVLWVTTSLAPRGDAPGLAALSPLAHLSPFARIAAAIGPPAAPATSIVLPLAAFFLFATVIGVTILVAGEKSSPRRVLLYVLPTFLLFVWSPSYSIVLVAGLAALLIAGGAAAIRPHGTRASAAISGIAVGIATTLLPSGILGISFVALVVKTGSTRSRSDSWVRALAFLLSVAAVLLVAWLALGLTATRTAHVASIQLFLGEDNLLVPYHYMLRRLPARVILDLGRALYVGVAAAVGSWVAGLLFPTRRFPIVAALFLGAALASYRVPMVDVLSMYAVIGLSVLATVLPYFWKESEARTLIPHATLALVIIIIMSFYSDDGFKNAALVTPFVMPIVAYLGREGTGVAAEIDGYYGSDSHHVRFTVPRRGIADTTLYAVSVLIGVFLGSIARHML